MTGYDLVYKLRKTRRRYPLTATEQALFHELVEICHEDEFVDTFSCSNQELCNALRITENTLDKARLALIQAGLLFYKSGKSKRQFGSYSFSKKFEVRQTTSNNEVKADTNKGVNAEVNKGVNAATNAEDCIKEIQEIQPLLIIDAGKPAKQESLEDKQAKLIERQKAFYNELSTYVTKYDKEMLRKFYDYWREQNKSKTKMKFELEKTWDTSLRLIKWESNQQKFKHGNESAAGTSAARVEALKNWGT